MIWAVGNPYTETFTWVEVVYVREGEVIHGEPGMMQRSAPASRSSSEKPATEADIATTGILMVPSDEEISARRMRSMSGGSSYGTTLGASEPERLQFRDVVRISRDQVFFVPDNSTGIFSSFDTAYYDYKAQLDQAIRIALTTQNPLWQGTHLSGLQQLLNTLEALFGRGASGCVLFANGQIACFQVNILYPGAPRYLAETGFNANGEPILEDGMAGGGLGVDVFPGNDEITYRINGSLAMRCGYVMGQLQDCYWVQAP